MLNYFIMYSILVTNRYYKKGINELVEWTQRWLLNLNTKKCLVVSFGRDINKDSVYTIPHKDQNNILERGHTVRDLG